MSNTNKKILFNLWNIIWLVFYFTACGLVFGKYTFDKQNFNANYFTILSFSSLAILVLFQYRELRKWPVYMSWIALTLILFSLSFYFKKDAALILNSGKSAALTLKSPFFFLLNYLGFNELSKRYFSTQLILPPRYSIYDTEEGRNSNILDSLALISGIITTIVSSIF
jgi:hypothetical protein